MIPLPAWLTGLGTKLLVAGAFVLMLLGAVLKLIGIGKKVEQADRAKADHVVRDRVDAVEPPKPGETEKSLQDGKF